MSRNQNRKGGTKRGRPAEWHADQRDVTTLDNRALEVYYKDNVVSSEEWPALMACLRTSLPMALRVSQAVSCAFAVDALLTERISHVFEVTHLPFFPNKQAIQCGVSRGDLKRNAEFKSLKKLIGALNEGGFITRQETVSMLPPLVLQVKPGHRVLDLCAAPGSKTSQIMEVLLADPNSGVLVANDVNASRLDVLHHQTNRSAGAHPHLIITNYDATRFPILPVEARFDRVLCDVMCSGDGTLRKSLDMWPRWNTLLGADLHVAQSRVLLRGMANCKKGGIVVYSTCSLNPVEDEAVVSECLRQSNGAFRLIDPTSLLPGLVASPGMTTWTLTTKDLTTTLHNFGEAQAWMEKQTSKHFQYKASMFADTELLKAQNIHFTRRVLPHQQDTGGFFVAALECVDVFPGVEASTMSAEHALVPIRPLTPELAETVKKAMSLPDSFPFDQLLFRSEATREQKIYYANKDAIALSQKLGFRVVNVGSKLFEAYVKYTNDRLRMSIDGVANLAPLLPSLPFLIPVTPQFLLDAAGEGGLSHTDFEERTGTLLSALTTPTFILQCELPTFGRIPLVGEKSTKVGRIVVKVPEWLLTLCRYTLGLPLFDAPAGEEEKEAGGVNGAEDV